ncbi:MAG: hypothetical protein HKO87_08620 [Acidimicrobiia bacterium]|nr:hypothetical protein [Acidimicrobiia bacterium]
MTPLILICIVLGWAGVLFAWARDRLAGDSVRGPVGFSPSLPRPDGPFAPPRSARMARRRRREVLVALTVAALCSFVLARAWSALWLIHLLVDGVLVAYLAAVVSLERPGSARPSIAPVVHPEALGRERPGPRRRPQPVMQ